MVPEREGSPIGAPELDLRDNDRLVLDLLRSEPSWAVGFQGLRRRLRIHPEQLSRALHRLARDDLIMRTDVGYRVSPRALTLLSPEVIDPDPSAVPVLQTYLPADTDLRRLPAALKGAWMGPLRWYGQTESRDELQLSWATEDDAIQLDARLRPGQLTISASATSADRLDEAIRLGHLLFQLIVRQVSRDANTALSG